MLKERKVQEAPELVVHSDDNSIGLSSTDVPSTSQSDSNDSLAEPHPVDSPAQQYVCGRNLLNSPRRSTSRDGGSTQTPLPMSVSDKRQLVLSGFFFILLIALSGIYSATDGSVARGIFTGATIFSVTMFSMFIVDWINPSWYRKIPPAKLSDQQANWISRILTVSLLALSFFFGLFMFVNKQWSPMPPQISGPFYSTLAFVDLPRAFYKTYNQYLVAVRSLGRDFSPGTKQFLQHRENLLVFADKLPAPSKVSASWSALSPELSNLFLAPSQSQTEERLKKIISFQLNQASSARHPVTPMWSELATELDAQSRFEESELLFNRAFDTKHHASIQTLPWVRFEESLTLLDDEDKLVLQEKLRPLVYGNNVVLDSTRRIFSAPSPHSVNALMRTIPFRDVMNAFAQHPEKLNSVAWGYSFYGDREHQAHWRSLERMQESFGMVQEIRVSLVDSLSKEGMMRMSDSAARSSATGRNVVNPLALVSNDMVLMELDDANALGLKERK